MIKIIQSIQPPINRLKTRRTAASFLDRDMGTSLPPAEKELQEALGQALNIGYDSLKYIYDDLLATVSRTKKATLTKNCFMNSNVLKVMEASW